MTTTQTDELRRAAASMYEWADLSLPPAVVLAVADWLSMCAANTDRLPGHEEHHALTVARAYLGESA